MITTISWPRRVVWVDLLEEINSEIAHKQKLSAYTYSGRRPRPRRLDVLFARKMTEVKGHPGRD